MQFYPEANFCMAFDFFRRKNVSSLQTSQIVDAWSSDDNLIFLEIYFSISQLVLGGNSFGQLSAISFHVDYSK